jgi:hypothetical protein
MPFSDWGIPYEQDGTGSAGWRRAGRLRIWCGDTANRAPVQPVMVTGVSIGAINAAAIAGARGGNIRTSLKRI